MKQGMIWLIQLYQKVPTRWHLYCRHVPTCSEYAITALEEYGCIKGSFLAIRRILHCNPFTHGGYDPVPKNPKRR